MLELLAKVRSRLAANSYANEAAISHGVVTPVLNALGWDSSDPDQLVPEFSSGKGRVDFALIGLGQRPAVFIEVKGLGRAIDGDRQLFEYAFHEGVPMCVLTDGSEWSFYLPGAQGSYEDRRVYLLRLNEREPVECQSVLLRYLSRERVRSNAAFEDAQRDYKDAARKREARATLPRAWAALLNEPEDLLLEIMADKTEALCGSRPSAADVLAFLRQIGASKHVLSPLGVTKNDLKVATPPASLSLKTKPPALLPVAEAVETTLTAMPSQTRGVDFHMFGKDFTAANASDALLKILETICSRNPSKLPDFAREAAGRTRKHIGQSASEIYPDRPDLKVSEFYPGWFVGLNIANREKMRLIRTACDVYGLNMPSDAMIALPNSG